MNTTDRCLDRLDALVALSERMLALARAGQWLAVAEAQAERQSGLDMLGALNDLGLQKDDTRAQLIRARLQDMLDINNEMMKLGREARGALSGQLRTLADGQSARKAYLENGG